MIFYSFFDLRSNMLRFIQKSISRANEESNGNIIDVKIRKLVKVIGLIQKSSFFLRNSNEKIPLNHKLKIADKYCPNSDIQKEKRPSLSMVASLLQNVFWIL